MFATITPTRLTECEAAFLALIGDDPHHVGCPVMKDPGDRKHRHGLVHNAIEAMAATDRSRVLRLITQRRDPGTITVAVQDSGPGIDPKELDKMFEAFVTTKTHGIGLGLAICRQIVERHNGQLSAWSDGKNGALFQLVLLIKTKDADALSH